MERTNKEYSVRHCSKCHECTTYFCEFCKCDMCSKCTEKHLNDLKTFDHEVRTYRLKESDVPNQIMLYSRNKSDEFKHRNIIHCIKSEALFYRKMLMTGIKSDFKTCFNEIARRRFEMITKAHKLRICLRTVLRNFDYKHRCLQQKSDMIGHIVTIQTYEKDYENSAITPLKLILSLKKSKVDRLYLKYHSKLSMTESLNTDHLDGIKNSLSVIKVSKRQKRRLGLGRLLKLMPEAEFHQSFRVAGVHSCFHFYLQNAEEIWISEGKNLILTNRAGDTKHVQKDLAKSLYGGGHTLNAESELIYIAGENNINKVSYNLATVSAFIKITDSAWKLQCVFSSPSTGNILVGMYREKPLAGMIAFYNRTGQLTQTIQEARLKPKLYQKPNYITENNNGDIVVSDFYWKTGSLVVTERGGNYRFSYTGTQLGQTLSPRGICTDALSNILVCDASTFNVHMIDKNGHFLKQLLTRPSGIFKQQSLCYEFNTHRILVGSWDNNKVCVYRYITRRKNLTDENLDAFRSTSEIQFEDTEKKCEGNELKMVHPPKLHLSVQVAHAKNCNHISCMSSDRIWVSDEKKNLILTNTTGELLCKLKDVCSFLFRGGVHTVTNESELIYIERYGDINKLSSDLRTITPILRLTNLAWRPNCVYWSLSTRDLLIGIYDSTITKTGKVIRYNQTGTLTQTIQHDNVGLELFKCPLYLTENINGDIVVSISDSFRTSGAVIVTERGGRHRFSYYGHPSESGLLPLGVCTDALSHIFICDDKTKTVHMLDRDGQFISHLQIESKDIEKPRSLSYDFNTHHLWNTLVNYGFITRQDPQNNPDILTGYPLFN